MLTVVHLIYGASYRRLQAPTAHPRARRSIRGDATLPDVAHVVRDGGGAGRTGSDFSSTYFFESYLFFFLTFISLLWFYCIRGER